MNAKYYPIIKLCRQAALLKRRLTLPVKLFTSGFINSESYYPEMPQKGKFRIAMDLLGHIMKYGSLERYYFSYGLDIKGFRDKDDYLDDNWFLWKCAMLNTVLPDHDYTCILRDKDLFATLLTEWGFNTPHTIACVKSKDDADVVAEQLFAEPGNYFCKPLDGQCGGGIFKLIVKADSVKIDGREMPLAEAKNWVKEQFAKDAYLIQSLVVQHPEISRIYDKSVNTLRVLTIYDKAKGMAVPVAGEVRFGANGSVVDNLAAGGVAVGVDLQTGRLTEYGVCKKGGARRTKSHPDTQVVFSDVSLPFVREAVQQAVKLHNKLSSIRLIGWDIAITADGPVFIEGNDNPEISGLQTVNGGLKRNLTRYLEMDYDGNVC